MRRILVDKRLVYYWSRSPEGKTVNPLATKNHFEKKGVPGILFGEPGYKNPWIQANSVKYFTYLDYEKIYDFDLDTSGELHRLYRDIQKHGGQLLPRFEEVLLEKGYEGYTRQKQIKYFRETAVFRDYNIQDTQDAGLFFRSVAAARKNHEVSGCDKQLTSYTEEDFRDLKLFIGKYGSPGFALQGDNIVSVFSDPFLTPGALPNLMDIAVRNGGRRVDVFDTFLPRIYAREGFRSVSFLPWNDKYAPDGWDYEKMKQYNSGRPNVVFMIYDPENQSDSILTPVTSYEEAEEIQRYELNRIVV
jgi:hypothetical protein